MGFMPAYEVLPRLRPPRGSGARLVAGAAPQWSRERVGVDEDAGGRGFRASKRAKILNAAPWLLAGCRQLTMGT